MALSPVKDDARLSTSAKVAWIRSGSSESMVLSVERRLAQLVAKSTRSVLDVASQRLVM